MWGAGQMMFNKILVLADEHVRIQDYEALARYVFKNLDPGADIYFSQGPMDVLDHSCSKLGFGGKMCLDGTAKFEEERDDQALQEHQCDPVSLQAMLGNFEEIRAMNASLLQKQIPVLVLSVEKKRPGHIGELHQKISLLKESEGLKLILYVEHTVDATDLPVALWRFCNNLDPKRDYHLSRRPSGSNPQKTFSCMGLDGTIKTKELDNFQRDWPNIIISDEATIRAVDAKWDKLGLGQFLPSPSLKFKGQIYGEEAVVQ